MINHETSDIRIIIGILNLLSVIGCSLIIWTVYNTPRMSKNPGKIIQRIAISQLICSIQLLLSQFYYSISLEPSSINGAFEIGTTFCSVLGTLQIWVGSQYIFYNVYFVCNLFLSVNIAKYNFTQYFTPMELISLSLSFALGVAALIESDVGIGVLGQCSISGNIQITYAIILSLLLILTLVLLIYLATQQITFQTPIYNTEIDKFKDKYQSSFIRVNIFYSVVFLLTHLIPEIFLIIDWLSSGDIGTMAYIGQKLLLLNISLAGILLFLIRLFDPLVYKYFLKSITGKKTCKQLKQKLMQKSIPLQQNADDNDDHHSKDHSLEITYYSGVNDQVVTINTKKTSNDQNLYHSQCPSLKKQKSTNSCILKSKLELIQLLIGIKQSIRNYKQNIQMQTLQGYQFIKITKVPTLLKHSPEQLDQLITSDKYQSLELNDFIVDKNYYKQLICFSYADQVLMQQFSQCFGITDETIRKSLNITQNITKIKNMPFIELNKYGPAYITHDNQFQIDLITTSQKTNLTRGGSLMNICKRWQDELLNKVNDGGSLLPAILGVYSVQFEESRFVNAVLRLNIPKIQYPYQEEQWLQEIVFEQLIRNNVIGWSQVSIKGVQQRFKAKNVFDGQYQIKLINEDFKLSEQASRNLISVLRRDLLYYTITNNLSLTFIYFKFTTARLQSIVQHEEKNELKFDLIQPPKSQSQVDKSVTLVGHQKCVGCFELDCKIGYVKVYFDDFWSEPYVHMSDEERSTIYERLIEIITEII